MNYKDYGIGKRDVKFRAWDKIHEFWMVNKALETALDGNINGKIDAYDFVVLTQYTGLKDKNGEEVYEGDIINFTYPTNTERRDGIGVVQWYSSGWIAKNKERSWSIDYEGSFNIKMEVIGNIFENPELIN